MKKMLEARCDTVKVIELDGKNFKDVEFVHNILKIKLELPQYYGNNLDALWDCLTGWIEIPVAIRWNNYDESYMLLFSQFCFGMWLITRGVTTRFRKNTIVPCGI